MKAYWYLTRASGAVTLILLTGAIVIGIATAGRHSSARWPRFAIDAVHRRIALLALVFLAIHVITTVADGFAPISLGDAVIPFGGRYRPLWLGFGATALDLLLAVAITSAVRRRIGHRVWRSVHWLAYAVWPIAAVHGLGTGSDAGQTWMAAVYIGCAAAVLVALLARVCIGWPEALRWRVAGLGAIAAFALGVAVWLPAGPLAPHWARRAGTPAGQLRPVSSRAGRG